MKSHQVIKESCKKRGIKSIASEIGVSSSLMYKWSQPYDGSGSGSKNPLDRIVELIKQLRIPLLSNGYVNNQEVTSLEILRADKKKTLKSCLQQMRSWHNSPLS